MNKFQLARIIFDLEILSRVNSDKIFEMAIVFLNAKNMPLFLLFFNNIRHITLLKIKIRNIIEIKQ